MQKADGQFRKIGDTLWVHFKGRTFTVNLNENSPMRRKRREDAVHNGVLQSPMPGKVLRVNVKPGNEVKKGQSLCVIEAMKMEYALKAPFDGTVAEVFKEQGSNVVLDEKILRIEAKK